MQLELLQLRLSKNKCIITTAKTASHFPLYDIYLCASHIVIQLSKMTNESSSYLHHLSSSKGLQIFEVPALMIFASQSQMVEEHYIRSVLKSSV